MGERLRGEERGGWALGGSKVILGEGWKGIQMGGWRMELEI